MAVFFRHIVAAAICSACCSLGSLLKTATNRRTIDSIPFPFNELLLWLLPYVHYTIPTIMNPCCSWFSIKALTRRRPLDSAANAKNDNDDDTMLLHRRLTATDLIFYGVGCSVGAGIYSLIGIGARTAGPAISCSFALAGMACCFTSLAYAEFASRVQTAGSAYTFCYVAFGELCGWLVGWNLTLGYAVSAAVVARSWAEYMTGFISGFVPDHNNNENGNDHFVLDRFLTKVPIPFLGGGGGDNNEEEYTCCPLAMVIIALSTLVLVTGVKESARFNTVSMSESSRHIQYRPWMSCSLSPVSSSCRLVFVCSFLIFFSWHFFSDVTQSMRLVHCLVDGSWTSTSRQSHSRLSTWYYGHGTWCWIGLLLLLGLRHGVLLVA